MSKFTDFLNLFMWDSIEDSEEEFNIDKALNDNWKKIDTKVKTHVTSVNEEINNFKEETNQKIENIQALPVGGTKGQVLTKQSETDGDANWEDIEANEVFVGNEEEAPETAKIIIEDKDFEESAGLSKAEVYVGAEEPTTGEKVWFRKGKNKFNPNDKTKGYLNTDGSFTSATDWMCSGFIEINSDKYILSANTTATRVIWCEYDSSMNIIGTRHEVVYGNPIAIVSTNTKYIRVCFNDNTATDIQLEQGTTVATSYEPYVEDKIFIKNASGNYEEFAKKSEEVYSTEEQRIGIWNGKKLYRKTIEVDTSSSFTNSTLTKYEHKIANIEKIIKATSTAKTSWGGGWFTDITLAINKFQIRADETYLYIKNDSGSDYKLEYLAVILEYTKTTD